MVKNHIDTDGGANPSASRDAVWMYNTYSYIRNLEEAYTSSQSVSIIQRDNFVDHLNRYDLGRDISHLVRLSPPCPVLYRGLWSIPPSEIWSSLPSGNKLIYHVSKWLEVRYKNVFGYNSLMFLLSPVFPRFDDGTHHVLAAS